MRHAVHEVRSFDIVGPYVLRVDFEDGVTRTIDFEALLEGELFGPLRDPALFSRVRIDPEVRTLVWPNGADFDPATLHDWPDVAEEMMALARRWACGADPSEPKQQRIEK
jgi:uncharacterized protein DUF2442